VYRLSYIPCLGKASDPLCLGGGLAWCVSAGSCGCVLVLARVTRSALSAGGGLARCVSAGSCGCVLVLAPVTRCCMGVAEVPASRLVHVIVCIVGLWAWWGFRCGLLYISGSACSTVGVHSQAWSTSGIGRLGSKSGRG
jgi:hypothetical protein